MSKEFDALASFRRIVEFNEFEKQLGEGVVRGDIHGEMHLAIGQEAIAVGLEPWLRSEDAVVSTHRPHLHALIAGVEPVPLLAELFERDGGLNSGKGGHMHLFDPENRFMCTGIVGASVPLALGYAWERQLRQPGSITVAVLGDGAVNQGTFAESLNMAALWQLPILFLIEDNGYAISVAKTSASVGELSERGAAFGIPGWSVDGTHTEAIFQAAGEAVAHVRNGKGPAILHAVAKRHRGHYEGDLDHYRSSSEKEENETQYHPVTKLRTMLIENGHARDEVAAIENEARTRVKEWVEEALEHPWPAPESAFTGVFT